MADAPIAVCEVCGAGPVEKLLFPVAVHFKGKGFYSTDYGRGSRGASKEGESAASGSESSKETPAGDKSPSSDSSGEKKSSGDGGTSTSSKSD
jgi:predicted nucleic acid-binding Zn ribbon protein